MERVYLARVYRWMGEHRDPVWDKVAFWGAILFTNLIVVSLVVPGVLQATVGAAVVLVLGVLLSPRVDRLVNR